MDNIREKGYQHKSDYNVTESALRKEMSLYDCKELKRLIVENPDLPLLIFTGEDAWDGNFAYSQVIPGKPYIDTLTLCGDRWCNEDDYRERLSDNLCVEDEYKDMSDEEFFKILDEKVANTEFQKAIVMYVG